MGVWREHRDLGLVTRAEARADGVTDRAIGWRVRSGRWQRLHPGVYATHPGPLDWLTRASGVVLCCGPGATLCDRSAVEHPCRTAAELAGLFWARGWRGSPRPCSPACPVAGLRRERPA